MRREGADEGERKEKEEETKNGKKMEVKKVAEE